MFTKGIKYLPKSKTQIKTPNLNLRFNALNHVFSNFPNRYISKSGNSTLTLDDGTKFSSESNKPIENKELLHLKRTIASKHSPFLTGSQNFRKFGEGSFYIDNSRYIELMEEDELDAIVSLHPRRFGKSLFVSMLQEYYDLKNRKNLKELFKGCYIGDHLTANAASYLVLALDFSNLNVTNFDSFQRNFNTKNNTALLLFLDKYKEELGDIQIGDRYSDFVENFIYVNMLRIIKGFKMYVVIDEYDSSLVPALSNTPFINSIKSNNDSSIIQSQFRRFFSYLKEANKDINFKTFVTGISPLCLTEFTTGWNHAVTISNQERYSGLYGASEEDISKGLKMIKPPLPKDIQDGLLQYCEIYNGYMFHREQKYRIFNTGRILYFLFMVRQKWAGVQELQLKGKELIKYLTTWAEDHQTKPAESTLKYIKNSKAAHTLLRDLLITGEVKCNQVDPYFDIEKLQTDRNSLISFMFYNGALTYAENDSVRIPNPDAKKEFIEAVMNSINMDSNLFKQIENGIMLMLEKEDISKLCVAFSNGTDDRGVRDFIQGEISFQEVVFNRLLLCCREGDKVYSEYIVDKMDRDSKTHSHKKAMDIVYVDIKGNRRFCFELKNIRIQDLEVGKNFSDNYDELKKISDAIEELDSTAVEKYQLKPKEESPVWFQRYWQPTIGQFVDKMVEEVRTKYQPLLQKDDETAGKSMAWVVVRVGLGKVISTKVY